MRVLILGGTSEAYALASALATDPAIAVETALAGVTRDPARPAGALRRGGFGGAAGLADHLRRTGVDRLVDATHPFATRISAQAAEAADIAGVPRLVLQRPPWRPVPGDRWIEVPDVPAAAEALPADARRVFLSIGARDLAPFAGDGRWYLLRVVDPPAALPLPDCAVVTGRGPFAATDERALLEEHRIDCVVAKNSGGGATYGKLAAARTLGLPVVMIARPPAPSGLVVETVEAALGRIVPPG